MAEFPLKDDVPPPSHRETFAELQRKIVGLDDLRRVWDIKSWTALSKEKLPILKAFAEHAELDVESCTKKDDFIRVIADALDIVKPGAVSYLLQSNNIGSGLSPPSLVC